MASERAMRRATRIVLAAVAIVLTDALWSGWSPGVLLSGLLTGFALVMVRDGLTAKSHLRGLLTTAWLYWGLSSLSNLIEAVAFRILPFSRAERAAGFELFAALVVAGTIEVLTPVTEESREPQTIVAAGVAWRIPLLAFGFFVIYIAAWIAIQPWIMSFYAHRPLPSLQQLLVLQLCRGLLDIACIYPWYRQWMKGRGRAAWLSAYAFAALCGWGPLLLPNRYIPGSIRIAHAVEMGAAGILFGVLTAFLLLKPSAARLAGSIRPRECRRDHLPIL